MNNQFFLILSQGWLAVCPAPWLTAKLSFETQWYPKGNLS
jgi:hypothetical protein